MSKSDIRENIKVYFRIFPMIKISREYFQVTENTIYVRKLQQLSNMCQKKCPPVYWEYFTDGIFLNRSQEHIYSTVVDDLLHKVMKGHSGIIVAFGQTGTGKSVTVGGLHFSEENFGIAPRFVHDLFNEKRKLPTNIKMCVQMSYVEFSTYSAADLLNEFPNILNVHEIRKANKVTVTSEFEALKLLYVAEARKSFADRNEYLSHIGTTIVTFCITTLNQDFTCPQKICSRLHIVDMAGVDTAGNKSSSFKNPLDIGKANIFKTNMEQFFLSLMENIPDYIKIKERMNPMIYYLGDDLNNKNILKFIGHIRILEEDLIITKSILRFGQLVKGLKPKLKDIAFEINNEVKAEYFQKQLQELQQEKLLNSVLLNQDLTSNLDQYRIQHIQNTVNDYLNNHINEISVLNVAEASEIFNVFKQIYLECEAERHKIQQDGHHKFQSDVNMKHKISTNSISSMNKGPKSSIKRQSKRSKDSSIYVDKVKNIDKISKLSITGQKIKPADTGVLTAIKSEASQKKDSKSNLNENLEKRKLSKTEGWQKTKLKSNSGNVLKQSVSKTDTSTLQMNKIKSSSINAMKRSVTKRKSSASTSVTDKRDSKTYIETALMPDVLPDHQELWNSFVTENTNYKTFVEYYRVNEHRIQYVHPIYLEEIKKLQYCRETIDKIKLETIEVQMSENFNGKYPTDVHDADRPSENDNSCKFDAENLVQARNNLLNQQEAVLKWQSELKICLFRRTEIKNQLHEDFENYCKGKVYISVPNLIEDDFLKEETISLNLEKVSDDTDIIKIQEAVKKAAEIESLQKIMRRILLKNNKLKEDVKKKWTNYVL